jgi:hypothetical protein
MRWGREKIHGGKEVSHEWLRAETSNCHLFGGWVRLVWKLCWEEDVVAWEWKIIAKNAARKLKRDNVRKRHAMKGHLLREYFVMGAMMLELGMNLLSSTRVPNTDIHVVSHKPPLDQTIPASVTASTSRSSARSRTHTPLSLSLFRQPVPRCCKSSI